MIPEIYQMIQKFSLTDAEQVGSLIAAYAVKEITWFIPIVGFVVAGEI